MKITFKLWESAEHRYYQAYIRENGEIWYNNSNNRNVQIWEPLPNDGAMGFQLTEVRILP